MFARVVLSVLLLAGLAAAAKPTTALAALESRRDLSTFTKLLEYAGVRPHLNSTFGKVTIFAPTNAAIAAVLKELKISPAVLGEAEYQLLVDRLVGYHVATKNGAVAAKDMKSGLKLTTASGGSLLVEVTKANASAAAAPAKAAAAKPAAAPAAAAKPAAAPAAAAKPAAAPKAGHRRFLSEIFARLLQATPAAAKPAAAAAPKAAAKPSAAAAAEVVTIKGAQNSAKVVGKPIIGGPAIIYPIDAVLLPDTVFATIKDALAYSSTTSTLAGLIANNTALAKAAANPKTNVTLFAPANSAFTALEAVPAAKKLLANKRAVSSILSYHASVPAQIVPHFNKNGTEKVETLLANHTLSITKNIKDGKGAVEVLADSEGAKPVVVKKHNIIAGASLINVVDGVLVPKF